jgi:hypothetical protein
MKTGARMSGENVTKTLEKLATQQRAMEAAAYATFSGATGPSLMAEFEFKHGKMREVERKELPQVHNRFKPVAPKPVTFEGASQHQCGEEAELLELIEESAQLLDCRDIANKLTQQVKQAMSGEYPKDDMRSCKKYQELRKEYLRRCDWQHTKRFEAYEQIMAPIYMRDKVRKSFPIDFIANGFFSSFFEEYSTAMWLANESKGKLTPEQALTIVLASFQDFPLVTEYLPLVRENKVQTSPYAAFHKAFEEAQKIMLEVDPNKDPKLFRGVHNCRISDQLVEGQTVVTDQPTFCTTNKRYADQYVHDLTDLDEVVTRLNAARCQPKLVFKKPPQTEGDVYMQFHNVKDAFYMPHEIMTAPESVIAKGAQFNVLFKQKMPHPRTGYEVDYVVLQSAHDSLHGTQPRLIEALDLAQ